MAQSIVSPAMQRKAEALADQAHTWHRGRSKQDGTPFFVIPASDGKSAHWANVHGCTCRSYQYRGRCAHHEACKLLQKRHDAATAAAVKAAEASRFVALLGPQDDETCSVPGCDRWATISGGTCREHSRSAVAA